MALEPMKLIKVDERSGIAVSAVTEPPPHLGPSINPMLIDLVIDNMFGYCDFETLERCRQVSKQWFQVSLPHWLKQGPRLKLMLCEAPTTPTPSQAGYRQNNNNNNNNITYMPEFLQLVSPTTTTTTTSEEYYEYCGLRQYKKFEVVGYVNDRHRELLTDFLERYGESLTDLKLSMTFADVATYQAVLLSRKTPNLVKLEADVWFDVVDFENATYKVEHDDVHEKLKTLRIDFTLTHYERRPPLPVLLWVQLLKRYPHLETLVHGLGRASRPQNADNLLEAVWAIRQTDKKVLDLKRLEVCCTEWNTDDVGQAVPRPYQLNSLMPLFRDAQLKLDIFSISIGELTPSQTIYEVLDSQAPTLKTLILHNHHKFARNAGPPNDFELPGMDCVRILELRGQHCPFPTLAFLKSFPNLESLIFDLECDVDLPNALKATKDEMLEELTLPKLCKFHCTSGYIIFEEQIRKLHRLMPNLTDLQMPLESETFRGVCGCWPGLKSLRIIGNGVDDDGLLGRIDRDGNMSANIRNLKELESFSMLHVGLAQVDLPVVVTGACVNPLLHLPKLTKLELTLDQEYEREHGYLLNTPVVRVEEREIDVNIKFAYNPMDNDDFDDYVY